VQVIGWKLERLVSDMTYHMLSSLKQDVKLLIHLLLQRIKCSSILHKFVELASKFDARNLLCLRKYLVQLSIKFLKPVSRVLVIR